ncbi:common central domain of tyrosinase domain-containing protein [Sarocladium implicatum]|nr:common central domain of tyrosinase domain-containing protein [Sarocladium implicatum]
MASQPQYTNVPTSEDDLQYGLEKQSRRSQSISISSFTKIGALIGGVLVSVVASFAFGYASGYRHSGSVISPGGSNSSLASTNCTEPLIRQEWRSLSKKQKKSYLDAFQCFIDSPSQLGMNGSLYDDFSWAHNLVAHSNHGKAPFLTWHRRFISVYEKQLRETCGYDGALPYWDWSLDWEEPEKSVIFDSELGFGGDGDPKAGKFGHGHCVTDTPFKNLKPLWLGTEYKPHCLTRSFNDDGWLGHYISPESLADMLSSATYEEFYLALELKAHDIIPTGVRGDFMAFTAPNDPIFYLHHAQLDRVWWLWQMRDRQRRTQEYGGVGDRSMNVTLTDVLPLAGLDADLTVADIMDTEAGGLCYRYSYV